MKQYKQLLQKIISEGTWKAPARDFMPRTKSLFGTRMEFDMKDGFPLFTTKKMYYNSIFVELLWFIQGDTNIKYLVDNGCNIWNKDAYRWYLKNAKDRGFEDNYTLEEFIKAVKISDYSLKEGEKVSDWMNGHWDSSYKLGDLGKVYGAQWRNQNGVDQLKTVIERLIENPEGRYAILDAWNPSDFSEMALPPCHLLYQFNCREHFIEIKNPFYVDGGNIQKNAEGCFVEINGKKREIGIIYCCGIENKGKFRVITNDTFEEHMCYTQTDKIYKKTYYLDLQMYQRSCDTFLGVPFNIASASLLLHLVAKIVNMIPSKFIWVGGDTHIYENHLDQVDELLKRDPLKLCNLNINKEIKSLKDLETLSLKNIQITDYMSHSKIKAELKTGLDE